MRLNAQGQIARNHEGRAIAYWLDNETELFQVPIDPDDPNGPWHMVTRRQGVTYEFKPQGANTWAARQGEWMRFLVIANPRLIGSASWLPKNGRSGDVDFDGTLLALSDDLLTMYIGKADDDAVTLIARSEVQGDTRLIHGLLSWTASGQVRVYDTVADKVVSVQQVGPGAAMALAFRQGSDIWIAYQTDAMGGVVHRTTDATQGYRYGTRKFIYGPEIEMVDVFRGCRVWWSEDPGEFQQPAPLSVPVLGEGMVSLAPEPPDDPVGPVPGTELPDGTEIDLASCFETRAEWTNRGDVERGDSHGMQYFRLPDDSKGRKRYWFSKYAGLGKGATGELIVIDVELDGWIHLLADCSRMVPDLEVTFDTWPADTRWAKKIMRVGRQYGFTTIDHTLVQKTRDCSTWNPVGFVREQWIHRAWSAYYFGKDCGTHPAVEFVYNNTGRGIVTDPERWVERYIYGANGVSWPIWMSDPSDVVFDPVTGAATFPAVPTVRSQFAYLSNAPMYPPVIPACVPEPAIPPEEPPTMTPLPEAAVQTIDRFALMDPPPHGEPGAAHDDNCRAWMRRLCETLRFFHGSAFGHKATSSGASASKDVLAMREGSAIHGYDVLTAAGSGQPVLNNPPSWVDISDQFFIDVSPVNHFTGVTRPPHGRPALLQVPACSSFDLSEALTTPDGEPWLQMLKAEGVVRPRVLLARQPAAPTLAIALARIPLLLSKLAEYRLSAELTLLADTAKYGLTEAQALQWVRDCLRLILEQPAGVGCIQGANEPFHSTQQPFVARESFMRQVAALVPNQFPYTAGAATNGGGRWGNVSYLTTHGDRSRSAYQNAIVSKQLQDDTGLDVWEDEPIGVGEVDEPGRRTNRPEFGFELADAADLAGLAGATYHFEAGLTCRLSQLGPIQLDGLRRYVKRTGGSPQPPPVHPVLDVDFRRYVNGVYVPDQLSDAGYILYVENRAAYRAEIIAWCRRATGIDPAESDISQIELRNLVEREPRFPTPRIAMTEKWPTGAP